MTKRQAPPVKKAVPAKAEIDPLKVVDTKWTPFSLEGIDVRLFRARYYNASGNEVMRPGVPKVDPNYVWRPTMVREFAWATFPHDAADPTDTKLWTPCLFSGPKGSGKTSFVVQMAAHCNVPIFRINLNVGTSVRHLKGRVGAVAGQTVLVPGVATMAMEQGGWLILDELSGATPPVALSLFPILETDGDVIIEDAQPPRYVRRSPAFRAFATDNVIGASREEDRFSYSGTNPDINEALLDRIGSLIEVDYMSPSQEHTMVCAKVPQIDSEDLEGMIRVATSIRESREISGGFSSRMVIEWSRRVAAGACDAKGRITNPEGDSKILNCAYSAFLHKQKSTVERDAMIEVIKRVFVCDDSDKSEV
jgi:cobaltochelatase CobS